MCIIAFRSRETRFYFRGVVYIRRQITVKYNGRVIFIVYLDPGVFTVGWVCRLVPIIQLPNLTGLLPLCFRELDRHIRNTLRSYIAPYSNLMASLLILGYYDGHSCYNINKLQSFIDHRVELTEFTRDNRYGKTCVTVQRTALW